MFRLGETWTASGSLAGGRGGIAAEVELHLRCFLRSGAGLEVRLRMEAEDAGEEDGRESPDGGVIFLGHLIEPASFHRDAVLSTFQLDLQIAETRARLEIRVVLGNDEQPLQRAAEFSLCFLEFPERRF